MGGFSGPDSGWGPGFHDAWPSNEARIRRPLLLRGRPRRWRRPETSIGNTFRPTNVTSTGFPETKPQQTNLLVEWTGGVFMAKTRNERDQLISPNLRRQRQHRFPAASPLPTTIFLSCLWDGRWAVLRGGSTCIPTSHLSQPPGLHLHDERNQCFWSP